MYIVYTSLCDEADDNMLGKKKHLCVAIQWDQSEVGSIDYEIESEKGIDFFCFLLF